MPHCVQDGVCGLQNGRQHGTKLRPAHTLIVAHVEDTKEKTTALFEGTMQDYSKATHKFFKADGAILDRERGGWSEEGRGEKRGVNGVRRGMERGEEK